MSDLPFAPACERNKGPILEQLARLLPEHGRVLEIASGTGQHAVHFAAALPGLTWQTSDLASEMPGLAARIEAEGANRLPPPLVLDVMAGEWPEEVFDAAFSANSAHIMSWEAVCAMFAGIGDKLAPGGPFCLYGPFHISGRATAPSNQDFDQQLRLRDSRMGLRDVVDVEALGRRHGLRLRQRIDMPANNMLLVFEREREAVT